MGCCQFTKDHILYDGEYQQPPVNRIRDDDPWYPYVMANTLSDFVHKIKWTRGGKENCKQQHTDTDAQS